MKIMRQSVPLAVLLIASLAFADEKASIALNLVSTVAVSPDAGLTAIVTGTSSDEIWLMSIGRLVRVSFAGHSHISTLAWSSDSKYLAIEAQDEDRSVAVFVVAAEEPQLVARRIGERHSYFAPKWSPSGHDLYVVPAYATDSIQDTSGLYRFDAETRKATVLCRGLYFMGDYSISSKLIVARTIAQGSGSPAYDLVAIDPRTGIAKSLLK